MTDCKGYFTVAWAWDRLQWYSTRSDGVFLILVDCLVEIVWGGLEILWEVRISMLQ